MPVRLEQDGYSLTLARDQSEIEDAQRLRYQVFVDELGGGGAGVDHADRIEQDRFDAFCDHLLLRETASGAVVGAYRLLSCAGAARAGGFYSETEYDLGPLRATRRPLLELGRSCVRADHRGGMATYLLWTGLARYVAERGAELLFGVASLQGTDPDALAAPLSLLHHHHAASRDLAPRSRRYQRMDLVARDKLDRRAAMVALPPLIKAYLRLGGRIGDGAYIDRAFNCTDVCMVMDTDALDQRFARHYRAASVS